MRYLGGKSKIAKRLAKIILAKTDRRARLFEPFVGGGAMLSVLAPYFLEVYASDRHESLILMWKALQSGWAPPQIVSEEQYAALRTASESALKGFAGFGPSWGGKYFGGYARGDSRNYADETRRSLLRDIQNMSNVLFAAVSYERLPIDAGAVLYADPPYAGTTEYNATFDSDAFWKIMRKWRLAGAHVFVSEYEAPPDWTCLWEQERTRDMRGDMRTSSTVTEKLFI